MKRAKRSQGSASKISKEADISSAAAVSSGAEVSSGDAVSSGAGVSSEAAVSSGAGASSGTGVSDRLTNSNPQTSASTSVTSKPSRLPRRTQAANRSLNIDEQPTSSASASNKRPRLCKKNQVPSQSPDNEPQPTTATAAKTKNSRASKKVWVPDETLENDQQSSTLTPATLTATKRSRVLKKPQLSNEDQQPAAPLPTTNKKTRVSKKARTSNIGQQPTSSATKTNDAENIEIDRNVPCGYPDVNCSICLSKINNKSFTDRCFHMFCFSCLREWSQVNPVCPLCKQTFKQIYYNINDANEFDVYDLKAPQPADDRIVILDLHRPPDSVEVRRDLYNQSRMVREVRVPNNIQVRYRELSPEAFISDDMRVRIAPWITREVAALLADETQVQFVQELINDLIQRVDIQSAEFYEHISPYFGDSTYHFIHEFSQFARTNLDMSTYDQHAVYYPPTVALLPTVLPTILPSVDLHFSIPTQPVQRMQPGESYYIDSDVEIVNTSEPAPPPPPLPPRPPEITDHAFFNIFPSIRDMFASIRTMTHRSMSHLPSNSSFMLPGTSGSMPTLSPVPSLGMFRSSSTLPPTLNAVNAPLIYDEQPLDLTGGYDRQALVHSRSPICLSSDSSANEGESSSTSCARSRMQKFRRHRRKRPRAYSSSSSEIENSRHDKRCPSLEIVDLSETIVEPVDGTILDSDEERTVADRETKTSFKKHPTGHKKSSGTRAPVENVLDQVTEANRSAVQDRPSSEDEVSNIRIVETISLFPAHRIVPTMTEIIVNDCIEISSSAATGENQNDPKLPKEEVTNVSEPGASELPHNSGTTELEYIQSLQEVEVGVADELNSIVENDLNRETFVDLRGMDTISVDSDDSVEFVDAFQNSGGKISRNISIMSSTDSDLLEVSDCEANSSRKSESVGRAKKIRDAKRRKNALPDMSRCIDLSSSDEEVLEIPKEDRGNRNTVISLFPKLILATVSDPNSETVDHQSHHLPQIADNKAVESKHIVEPIVELSGSSLHINDDAADSVQQNVTICDQNADNLEMIPQDAVCDVGPSTSATNNFPRDIVSELNQTTDYNLSSNTCQNFDTEYNLNTNANESAPQCNPSAFNDNESDDRNASTVQSNDRGSVQGNESEVQGSKVQGDASSPLSSESPLQCTKSSTLEGVGLIQSHEGSIQSHEGSIQVHEDSIQRHEGSIQSHEASIQSHKSSIQSHDGSIQSHEGSIQSHEGSIQSHEGESSIQNNESYIQQGNEGPFLGNESPLHGNEGLLEGTENSPQGNHDLNTSPQQSVMSDNMNGHFIQTESALKCQLTSTRENNRIVDSSECPQNSLVLIAHFDDPSTEQDGRSMPDCSNDCNLTPTTDFPSVPLLAVEHIADASCQDDAVPVYTDECKTEPDKTRSNSQNSLTSALAEVSNNDLPGMSHHLNKSPPNHPNNCSLKQNSTLQSGSVYNHAVGCSSELLDTRLNNDAMHSYDLARFSHEHTSAVVKNGFLTSCTSSQTRKLNSCEVDADVAEEADKNNVEPQFLENNSEMLRAVTDNDGSHCSGFLSSELAVDSTRLETAVVSS